MRWLLLFPLLFIIACTPVRRVEQPLPQIDLSIQRAIDYLQAEQSRAAFDLLPESPVARRNKHWLATDNQIAVYALRAAGETTFAAQLEQARQAWHAIPHGIIEALVGEPIAWPPHQEHQYEVVLGQMPPTIPQPNVCSEPENAPVNVVCQEIRDKRLPTFQGDWQDYADLALYGALSACNQGDSAQAQERFRHAMTMFNDIGFADKAYAGSPQQFYTTYKLALALYVGAKLGEPRDDKLLAALLAQQDGAGGFTTLYDNQGISQGDSNTETTAYALLALSTLHKEPSKQAPNSSCTKA